MQYRAQSPLIYGIILLLLGGCTTSSVLWGSSAALGTAAMQRRGVSGAAQDYALRLRLNDAWFQASLELYQNAYLLISHGRVLMMGRVSSEALQHQAEALAWQAGAKKVYNCLRVAPPRLLATSMRDKAISAHIVTQYTLDRDVSAINYDVATYQGVVYLIGEARYPQEIRRVRYLAEHTSGVVAVDDFIDLIEGSEKD